MLSLSHLAQTWNVFFLFGCSFSFKLEKELGAMRSVGLTLVPGEFMEHVLLESISKYVNGKKVIRSTQHSFTKGKSSLTEYGEMTSSAGEESVVGVVIL